MEETDVHIQQLFNHVNVIHWVMNMVSKVIVGRNEPEKTSLYELVGPPITLYFVNESKLKFIGIILIALRNKINNTLARIGVSSGVGTRNRFTYKGHEQVKDIFTLLDDYDVIEKELHKSINITSECKDKMNKLQQDLQRCVAEGSRLKNNDKMLSSLNNEILNLKNQEKILNQTI